MPTKHCAHSTCNSDSRYYGKEYMNNVTFVKFVQPNEDLEKCKRWVQACRRQHFSVKNVSSHMYICSKHFVGGKPSEDYPDPLPPGKMDFLEKKRSRKRKYSHDINAEPEHDDKRLVLSSEFDFEVEDQEDSEDSKFVDSSIQTDFLDEIKKTSTSMQTDFLFKKDAATQTVNEKSLDAAIKAICSKSESLKREPFTYWTFNYFQHQDQKFKYLTGVSVSFFLNLYALLGEENCETLKYKMKNRKGQPASTPTKESKTAKLTAKDKLFMTLVRLRRGFTLEEISIFFNITKAAVGNIVYTWIQFLYFELLPFKEEMFVPRQVQKRSMPFVFRNFKNIRIILDCFEVPIYSSTDFRQQGNTYSAYKSSNTVKFLLGISVNGAIMFISDGFEGSISDKEIFLQSGITKYLQPKDLVMVDRGFDIESELNAMQVDIAIPPRLKGRPKFTPQEEKLTKRIAKARIFVEHAVRRVKEFRIFSRGHLPLSVLPQISQIGFIIAFLVNSEKELVPD